MATKDKDTVRRDFKHAVNMTRRELQKWLDSDESRSVGIAGKRKKASTSGQESVGHESGRRIVDLLQTKVADLSDEDYAHMRKVTGYVHRHLEQKPSKESIEDSRWRYSLMNWGHDPMKA